jgi:segregation and condensation protein B
MNEQTDTSLKNIVEGLIFAADEPLSPKQIRELIEGESDNGDSSSSGTTPQQLQSIVNELNDDYERLGKPFRIRAIAGGYIFATNREVSTFVGKLHREQSKRRLTQASLETLAIIAYKQPITKVELETIRGVNCDYIVKSLLEKDLITIVGRQQSVGRPLLYGTTKRFLIHFGLNSVNELPKPREIEELIGETEMEVEKRLLEMERERQEAEEEMAGKRERKPHPLSDGAMAKIIPLKPDYRPLRKTEPDVEETEEVEEIEETQEIEETAEPVAEEAPAEIREPDTTEKTESTEEETTEETEYTEETTPEESEPPGEEIPEEPEFPEEETPAEVEPREEEIREIPHKEEEIREAAFASQRGWKKWKNKLVTFIKKIFG